MLIEPRSLSIGHYRKQRGRRRDHRPSERCVTTLLVRTTPYSSITASSERPLDNLPRIAVGVVGIGYVRAWKYCRVDPGGRQGGPSAQERTGWQPQRRRPTLRTCQRL